MPATLTRRRFNVDEYYRMARAGILLPGERVELIEGEIVRMAAIGSRHASCVKRLTRLLVRGVGERALVQVQDPVRLSAHSEPEPDIAVLRPRPDDYAGAHPEPDEVLLLIEVADTTLSFDRDVKGPLYAGAGIREYWLVDLSRDHIEVFRGLRDDRYEETLTCGRGGVLHPSALPELAVHAADALPHHPSE